MVPCLFSCLLVLISPPPGLSLICVEGRGEGEELSLAAGGYSQLLSRRGRQAGYVPPSNFHADAKQNRQCGMEGEGKRISREEGEGGMCVWDLIHVGGKRGEPHPKSKDDFLCKEKKEEEGFL